MAKPSFEIRNESTDTEDCYQLYVDGGPRALLTKRNNLVELNWEVAGPQYWPKAKVLMQGLLELSVIADQLTGKEPHEND